MRTFIARLPLSVLRPVLRAVAPLVVIALFAAAAAVLYRSFREHPWDRLGADLLALGPSAAAASLAATVASYAAMTGYDALALRYVEHPMPYRRFAVASFVATAFGNSLGASAVVGAALRARVYSSWQVPGFAITRIIGFNLVTLVLGIAVLSGAGLLHDPAAAAAGLHLPAAVVLALGAGLLLAVAGYVWWARAGGRPLGWRDWRVDRPSRGLAVRQVVLSTVEWITMAAALYALLPPGSRPGFLGFSAAFAVATTAGLVSNVPGGLGVFESVLLVLLGGSVAPAHLAVALVGYRLGYYLLPLLVAAVLLVVLEVRRGAEAVGGAPHGVAPALGLGVLTPSVLALGVAGVGVVLLVRGDLPGDTRAPNLSMFTMSLIGVGLLLLARGLHRRLHGAWVCSVGTLLVVVSFGAVHRETVLTLVAVVLLALLLPARTAFYRTTSLLTDPRGWAWPGTVAALATAAVWWHDLGGPGGAGTGDATWWAASLSGETPGPARLAVTLGVATVLVGGRRMVVPRRPADDGADADADGQLARAAQIVAGSGTCTAHLAFTGDKLLHFSESGSAFLMYQIEGRSWVSMGDPVGDPGEFRDLLWAFVERADRHGGRPVFYSVRGDLSDRYRECGLTLVKLGEEAVVPLAGFSLEGKSRQGMRWRRNQMIKAGCSVEFVPAEGVPALLPELRAVSDAWLAEGRTREKRFSLGAFDDDYVSRFPVAVVRQEGRAVAFASLWISGDGREVQVDLMRRVPGGPKHVMNYLFVECMLWAKQAGHDTFSLGMAPLSGLRTDANAPFWDRIGGLLWKHGEQFYNFQGLRHFKEQFDPEWQTRYVAAPGGPALPTAMLNVATLVGGGVRGILTR